MMRRGATASRPPRAWSRRRWQSPSIRNRRWHLAVAIGWAMLGAVAQAQAQVRVEGPPDAVQVEAHDVPLRKVLDELKAKFNLRYRADDGLDTAVTGNFHGSLRRVVVRVLDGYDFVMKI